MDIRARQQENVIVMYLSGRIDVNSANLVEAVGQCVRDGYNEILINLEEIESIDYMVVSVLVITYKEVINSRGRLKLANVPVHLKGVLSVSGLDRSIEMYPTEDLALNSFKEDKAIEHIKKMQLRRRFKRLPIDIKVELKVQNGRGALSCLQAEIVNLSAVGAYIFGCGKFKLGDHVLLKMKLPPANEELELDAKVVWLADRQVQPHNYPGIGVEFSNIPGPVQQKLLEFIERNLSHLSAEQ